jgi:hypothetical protein
MLGASIPMLATVPRMAFRSFGSNSGSNDPDTFRPRARIARAWLSKVVVKTISPEIDSPTHRLSGHESG